MSQYMITHIVGGGDRGGAKTHILSLLKNMDPQSFRVSLICLNDGPLAEEARMQGFPVQVFSMVNNLDMAVIFRIASYLKQQQPDLVHTHGVRANFCGRTGARLAGMKHIVTTIHSRVSMDYPTQWGNWFFSLVDRLSSPMAEHLICVSHQLKMYLVQQGIPAHKMSVIHNGIDAVPFRRFSAEDAAEIRAEWNIQPHQKVIGAVGRLVPIKGYDVFLKAAQKVKDRFPEAVFMIVGEGPCLDSLQELARKLKIHEQVLFTGFQENIPAFFSMMDVFVISSFTEGGPIVLLEAMAAGVPAIATRVGGVPEVLVDQKNGFMVEPHNPESLAERIMRLLEDTDLARRFQLEAQLTLDREYTVEIVTEKTQNLYRQLLEGVLPGDNAAGTEG